MLKVAITGNIASGKSEVEKILSKKFPVYDTDKIAHTFLEKITDFYGYDVFTDGKINRKKLGDLIFSNPHLKNKLENIIHPQVKDAILKIFDKEKDAKIIFISVPLLFETNFHLLFDKIIFVAADEEIRLQRLMKRNNLPSKEALQRINAQMRQEEKIIQSDFIIYNNSSFENLLEQVEQLELLIK